MNPAGCWNRPVYIGGQIQCSPGDNQVLNYDWLLGLEAVDAAGAGRFGNASLGHASLTRVTGWFQADFQSAWNDVHDASPFSCGALSFLGACGALPGVGDSLCRDLLREEGSPVCCDLLGKEGSPVCRDLLREWEWYRGPNLDTSPTEVGPQ